MALLALADPSRAGSTPGPIHHHANADQGDARPGDIGMVGAVAVDAPTPKQG